MVKKKKKAMPLRQQKKTIKARHMALAQGRSAVIGPQQWRRFEAVSARFVAKRLALQACRWSFDVLAMAPKSWLQQWRNAWRSQY